MNGNSKVIDDTGRSWNVRDGALTRHLGTSMTGEALIDYAVLNLGFVDISRIRRALIVRCRPKLITGPALIAAAYELHDAPKLSVVLRTLAETWQDLILRKRSDFVQLLGALTEQQESARFWKGPRHIASQSASENSYFVSAANLAMTMSSSGYSEAALTNCLDVLFKGRWSLCELDCERGQTIVRHIGNSYTPFNPGWLSKARNSSLCSYGDDAYGLWVAKHHRHVLDCNTPVIDEVDAVVRFPRIGDARLRYSRLTAPITVGGGRRLILTAAVNNSGIDLRKVTSHKAG